MTMNDVLGAEYGTTSRHLRPLEPFAPKTRKTSLEFVSVSSLSSFFICPLNSVQFKSILSSFEQIWRKINLDNNFSLSLFENPKLSPRRSPAKETEKKKPFPEHFVIVTQLPTAKKKKSENCVFFFFFKWPSNKRMENSF